LSCKNHPHGRFQYSPTTCWSPRRAGALSPLAVCSVLHKQSPTNWDFLTHIDKHDRITLLALDAVGENTNKGTQLILCENFLHAEPVPVTKKASPFIEAFFVQPCITTDLFYYIIPSIHPCALPELLVSLSFRNLETNGFGGQQRPAREAAFFKCKPGYVRRIDNPCLRRNLQTLLSCGMSQVLFASRTLFIDHRAF